MPNKTFTEKDLEKYLETTTLSRKEAVLMEKARKSMVEHLTVPEGYESIGGFAFNEIQGLKSITLPTTLKFISSNAFRLCLDLKQIDCYSPIVFVAAEAINACTKLERLNLTINLESNFSSIFANGYIPKNLKTFRLGKIKDDKVISKTYVSSNTKTLPNQISIQTEHSSFQFKSISNDKQ